jgi:transposase-like protein
MYCDRPEQLVEIDDLIERMSVAEDLYESERKARVAEQLIFGGLTVAEVAQMMGVGEATIKRDWVAIKAWFATRLGLADPSRHRVDRDDV